MKDLMNFNDEYAISLFFDLVFTIIQNDRNIASIRPTLFQNYEKVFEADMSEDVLSHFGSTICICAKKYSNTN